MLSHGGLSARCKLLLAGLLLAVTVQPSFATCQTQPSLSIQAPDQQAAAVSEKFTVIVDQEITGKSAHRGDCVIARLGSNLSIGGQSFAPGSTVVGHVTEVERARRHLIAEVSPKRWLHASGAIGLEFDEIDAGNGASAYFHAIPVSMPKDMAVAVNEKHLSVSKKGCVQPSVIPQIRPKVTRIALGVAALTHSPIVPLVGGLVGAIAPSMVLDSSNPEAQAEIKHRRLKGCAVGAIAGIPFGGLVNDAVLKGQEAEIKPGTVLLLQLQPESNPS